MAAISGGRATDERVTCLQIFADANGETHMEDVDIPLQPRKLFKVAASWCKSATYLRVCVRWTGTIRHGDCWCSG